MSKRAAKGMIDASKPRTAIGYLRVSTSEQGNGLDVQRAAILAWAKRENVTIVDWREEIVSGAADNDDRPMMLEAIALCGMHKVSFLVMHKVDRFSRDILQGTLATVMLKREGTALAFVEGGGSGDDPASKAMRGMLLVFAEYERAMIEARTRATVAIKRAKGEAVGPAPFGMRAVDGARLTLKGEPVQVLVPDSGEQATIARILALHNEGLSYRDIASDLEAEGVKGRGGSPLHYIVIGRIINRAKGAE
jgi:site-specific DNA recombinase